MFNKTKKYKNIKQDYSHDIHKMYSFVDLNLKYQEILKDITDIIKKEPERIGDKDITKKLLNVYSTAAIMGDMAPAHLKPYTERFLDAALSPLYLNIKEEVKREIIAPGIN